MKNLFILLISLFIFGYQLSAQNSNRNNNKSKFIAGIKSVQQVQIENELNSLKREDNSSNLFGITRLNRRLESITGQNISVPLAQTGEGFQLVNQPVPFFGNTDFIQNSRIYSNTGTVVGIAAAIEQRGTTAGKIWAVVIYSAGPTSGYVITTTPG